MNPLDLSSIRAHLAKNPGSWRSLEEAAGSEEFMEYLHREFPVQASEWKDEFSRRGFLKLMGASLALAGLTACTKQPIEKIVPYVRQPEEVIPGKPLFFATAAQLGGCAIGLLAESHEGRPTKLEGNPDHPASLGGTSVFAQAAILDLYDPDRSQEVVHNGRPSSWAAFLADLDTVLATAGEGHGLRILTETVTSPTLAGQLQQLLARYRHAKWHQFDPINRDSVSQGALLAFGENVETHYHFDKAEVVLAIDSDFLFTHPASLRFARQFAQRRRVISGDAPAMNRLYAVESTPSITGAMADHRFPARAGESASLVWQLAAALGVAGPASPPIPWLLATAAKDIAAHRGSSIVIAGEQQPAEVHALVHHINQALGNFGATITFTDPVAANPVNQLDSIAELVRDMREGVVDTLVILEGNPAFSAPADLRFVDALSNVQTAIRLGLHEDETSALCHWHIPATHFLETWSDARAFDGTVTVIQPLIEPLYEGRSSHEVLEALLGKTVRDPYSILRESWQARNLWPDFDIGWHKTLHDGVLASSALPQKQVALAGVPPQEPAPPAPLARETTELVFRPDPNLWDGRFANNAWLQELAKPFTKLTWDNAALISPRDAQKWTLQNGDVVELRFQGRALKAPVWILPGQAENSVCLHLGNGRTRAGRVGAGAGFNSYALRGSDSLWFASGLEIFKTHEKRDLVSTQHHFNIEGREVTESGTLRRFLANPEAITARGEPMPPRDDTLYPGYQYKSYAWGMAIDLNTCIGCNACVIACQAENNIPVVGKYQVAHGREMQWIRVDTYFEGDLDRPQLNHEPVPCMHCENAPCELVCPVGATVHDDEGLNVQVYNRCIGTRYCSNNCPYKVRRFNFIEFNGDLTPSEKLGKNPNVTVRSRGVMEKCTYCTQRINAARINAELADRKIRDGEIVTACQAACPAEAIVFGDINDPHSRVAKIKAHPLNYAMLRELNTRPRTTYQAKLRNPNPNLES